MKWPHEMCVKSWTVFSAIHILILAVGEGKKSAKVNNRIAIESWATAAAAADNKLSMSNTTPSTTLCVCNLDSAIH